MGTPGNSDATHAVLQRVSIRRDRRGVPCIRAGNDADLYFATGFVVASDRLWQLDLLRRTACGRVAELLGADAVDGDFHFRAYRFAELSRRIASCAPSGVQLAFQAYADGVNAYIATLTPVTMPAEFQLLGCTPEPWTPADSVAVGKVLAEALGSNWISDLMRASFAVLPEARRTALLSDKSPLDVLLVGDDDVAAARPMVRLLALHSRVGVEGVRDRVRVTDPGKRGLSTRHRTRRAALDRVGMSTPQSAAASNGWVVGGSRTRTGRPLLANDPHLSPSWPCTWYLIHQTAPGVDVSGSMIPGSPFVMIGHNATIAWGLTNMCGDEQDLFRERPVAGDPRSYETADGPRAFDSRTEIVFVRNPATRELSFESREMLVSSHGPIVYSSTADGAQHALRWTALAEDANEFAAFGAIGRASTADELTHALSTYSGPSMNCCWATADGHIGYQGIGRLPIRREGDGTIPYAGEHNDGDWIGYVPFDELPRLVDPPNGIIVTANNRVVGDSYPHYLTHAWYEPYRARRIFERLGASSVHDIDSMTAIQADCFAYGALGVALATVAALAGAADPEAAEVIELLAGWDGTITGDSRAAPIAFGMRKAVEERVLRAAIAADDDLQEYWWWPSRESFIDSVLKQQRDEWRPPEFATYEALFRACYRDAVAALTARLSDDRRLWTWAAASTPIQLAHPLAAFAPDPTAYQATLPNPTDDEARSVNAGRWVSMRFVADLADWDRTRQGLPLGISGDVRSVHFRDQLEEWHTVKTGTLPFSTEQVDATSEVWSPATPAVR
jgi:penicillin amidase